MLRLKQVLATKKRVSVEAMRHIPTANWATVARKKSALDLLGKIENDFALLRDKCVALGSSQDFC